VTLKPEPHISILPCQLSLVAAGVLGLHVEAAMRHRREEISRE
jgi:hypothetical protein